ncbi:unnamed protein product [Psylliodes chrysocephalus]|uniref:Uncharacterized protein n=1 Tax=Psylliodes chrysocephalus TaxID=3402493 RepID=A0A9P0G6W8_9CUCU|nr:unnamed protein product [Psylliodes chrysocephala]
MEENMIEIQLTYEGNEFTTFVNQCFYDVLRKDPTTLQNYAELVYNKEHMNRNDVNEDKENDKFYWSEASVKLLLDKRLSMEKDFIQPKCSKKKIVEQNCNGLK